MSEIYEPYQFQINSIHHGGLIHEHSQQVFNQYLTTIGSYVNYGSMDQNAMNFALNNFNGSIYSKVKTSLCKKFAESGNCPYGLKCQFAHGIAQLRCNVGEISYKTKHCNAFFKKGYCQYGDRCNFSHKDVKNAINDSQNKQSLTNFMSYREVTQEGKLAAFRKSALLDILKKSPQQSDQKSISSTQQSKSDNLSRSHIDVLCYQGISQFNQNNSTHFYNQDKNIIVGNLVQVNSNSKKQNFECFKENNFLFSSHFQDQGNNCQKVVEQIKEQEYIENENEGTHLFNIDYFL